jgi:cell division protein FtsB
MTGKAKNPFMKRLTVLMVGLVMLLLFAHGLLGKRGYFTLKRMKWQNDNLGLRIEQLKRENSQVMEEIKSLKTDPKTIEKIAREELGLVKPGEIKITTSKTHPESKADSSTSQP